MLYRIDDEAVNQVKSTKAAQAGYREVDIEGWIEKRPEILGEELLIIGRQVAMDDGKDRIDLLAMDRDGNLVVAELALQ